MRKNNEADTKIYREGPASIPSPGSHPFLRPRYLFFKSSPEYMFIDFKERGEGGGEEKRNIHMRGKH